MKWASQTSGNILIQELHHFLKSLTQSLFSEYQWSLNTAAKAQYSYHFSRKTWEVSGFVFLPLHDICCEDKDIENLAIARDRQPIWSVGKEWTLWIHWLYSVWGAVLTDVFLGLLKRSQGFGAWEIIVSLLLLCFLSSLRVRAASGMLMWSQHFELKISCFITECPSSSPALARVGES